MTLIHKTTLIIWSSRPVGHRFEWHNYQKQRG